MKEHTAHASYKSGTSPYLRVTLLHYDDEAFCRLAVRTRNAEGGWDVPEGWDESFTIRGSDSLLFGTVSGALYLQIAMFLEAVLLAEGRLDVSYQSQLMRMRGSDFAETAEAWEFHRECPYTDKEMQVILYG